MYNMDLQVGDPLPPLRKPPIDKRQLVQYAGASGDFNLIHLDAEAARAAGLKDIIAHGMLSMGFLGEYLARLAGPGQVRRLQTRFKGMVYLGDVLTCNAVVKSIAPVAAGRRLVTLELWAENQAGEKVTVGEGEVYVPQSSQPEEVM